MSKTLQEIQKFNRRKIICAINGTEVCFSHIQALELLTQPLTLDRLLLGLKTIPVTIFNDISQLKPNDISQLKPELKFYNGFIITINGYAWDLTKRTLEEQSEETQRAIYELLGGENE